MSSLVRTPGELVCVVPEDWMQGRSVFGGLQIALALAAMRPLVPDVPLRTVQATFVAPVPEGAMRVRAEVMRRGKSATHVEARIVDGETTLAVAIGVFGAARSSTVAVARTQPEVPPSRGWDFAYVPGVTPAFTQHFAARWLRGGLPFSGDVGLEHVIEVSMHDPGPCTEGHVIALADFLPPLALAHLRAPAPGSTLTWMLELCVDRFDDLPLSGWRTDAELVAARDGYTNQSAMLYGPSGALVALSRQSMVVFG